MNWAGSYSSYTASADLMVKLLWIDGAGGLKEIFNKIDAVLIDEEGDYDDEFLQPAARAIREMKRLLAGLYPVFGNALSRIRFIPNGKGGIEGISQHSNRHVDVVVPSEVEKKPYIFKKEGDKYGIEPLPDLESLIATFTWLFSK